MLEVARDYALMLLHIAVLCAVAPMMLVLSPFVYMIHYAASWPSVLGPSPPTGEAYLITGASVGLGAALATQLAAKPSTKAVYLVSRSAEHMETTRRACRAVAADPALTVRAIEADVQNADAMRRALIDADDAELSSGRPGLTCVVANAGVSKSTWDPDGNRDISAALDVIDINLQGALRSITPVVDRFLKRAYGQIVLVSSVASMVETLPCTMSYGASKAGLRHFGEALKGNFFSTMAIILFLAQGLVRVFFPFIMATTLVVRCQCNPR